LLNPFFSGTDQSKLIYNRAYYWLKKLSIMKVLLIIMAIPVLVACNAVTVPVKVISSFSKTFPSKKNPHWIKVNENYQAIFKINNKEATATFDAEGKWMQTEIPTSFDEIPDEAAAYTLMGNKHPAERYACRIVKNTGDINYGVHIQDREMLFDEEGKYIKETKHK